MTGVVRSDEVAKKHQEYQAAHPDNAPTDLGQIEVRVSGAEAYAQGRRERADDQRMRPRKRRHVRRTRSARTGGDDYPNA